MTPRPAVYCSCGRLLKIKVRREGIILQCPEHGIVLRYKVSESHRERTQRRKKSDQDRKPPS